MEIQPIKHSNFRNVHSHNYLSAESDSPVPAGTSKI